MDMDRETGEFIDVNESINQTLENVSTTALGTRVLNRNYGISQAILDRPRNSSNLAMFTYAMYTATENARELYIKVNKVNFIKYSTDGSLAFIVEVTKKIDPDILSVIKAEFQNGGVDFDSRIRPEENISVLKYNINQLIK